MHGEAALGQVARHPAEGSLSLPDAMNEQDGVTIVGGRTRARSVARGAGSEQA